MIFAPVSGDPILGAKLRRRREELGLSQLDIAADVGVDRSHISNVERGKKPLGRGTLIKMARRLKLSLDFLAAAEGEDPSDAARARNETEAIILALVRGMSPDEADALVKVLRAGIPKRAN